MQKLISTALLVTLLTVGIPTMFRTIHRRFVGVKKGVTLEGRDLEYYYEKEARIIVEQIAREIQRAPVNASLGKSGEIIPEADGIYVDVDQTVKNVMNAKARTQLSAVQIKVTPRLRQEHLATIVNNIGDFSTTLMGAPGRISNIRLSLAALNNTLVMPGEVFSFNGVVGERTEERGYKSAPIILGEAVVPGVGGGICQTSTTLYNAVARAGLEIVERRIHSIAPSYIQHGKDATVAWPHTDFKFRNNRDTPIIVKGEVQGWRVRVWVLGAD